MIFKGILSPVDAMKSVDAGADAIVVSNHGGHTLDYLPHAFQVMGSIVKVVEGKPRFLWTEDSEEEAMS